MIESIIDTLQAFPRGLVFVGLGLVVLLLAKLARDVITPYKIDQEVGEKQNLAVSLRLTGYLAGVIFWFSWAPYIKARRW